MRTLRRRPHGWLALAETLLAGMPALRQAACRDHQQLFAQVAATTASRGAIAAAQTVCTGCPELSRCRAWVDSLPPSARPYGVIAGQVTTRHR